MARYFCGCGRCTIGAVTPPLMLITVGVLFAMDHFGHPSVRQTWPVILIVYGLARALASLAPVHDGK